MKKRAGIVSLVLALVLAFALTVPAAAANDTKTIDITRRAIRLVVDGVTVTPADASGSPVEPFIYNGTTYLPVRAVAGALGLGVNWDEAASTVLLTTGGEVKTGSGTPAATSGTQTIQITYRDIKISIDGAAITPRDAGGNAVEPFIYNGTTYLPVRAVASALGVQVNWDDATSTVYLGAVTSWLLKTETDYYEDGAVYYVDTYTYDEFGRVTSITTHFPEYPEDDYTVTRTYDAAGNVVFEDYGDSYSRYSYDAAGNMVSDKYYYYGSLTEWKYTYDAAGRCMKVVTEQDGEVYSTTTYTYDTWGNVVRVVNDYDGYISETGVSYTYGAAGRIENSTYTYSEDGYEYGEYYAYTYDAAGQMTVEYRYFVEDGEKEYMSTNRYTYDKNGNCIRLDYDGGYTEYVYTAFSA